MAHDAVTDLIIALIAVLGAGSLFALIYAFAGNRSRVKQRLLDLGSANAPGADESMSFFARVYDQRQRNAIARKLMQAGWYTVTPARMGLQMLAFGVAGMLFGLMLMVMTRNFSLLYFTCCIGLGFAGAILPTARLNRAVRERHIAIVRELPNFLDVVSTTVEAGIALNGALATALEVVRGPLREELDAALSDIRVGRTRAEALSAMAARVQQPELSATIATMLQSERLGGSVAGVLQELAQEARNRRIARAEELAAALPVKMVFPMAGFMLPALLLLIFGSVAADYMSK